MKKCYILCGVENQQSNYINFNSASNSIITYLGKTLSQKYDVVFINIGAPYKHLPSKSGVYIFSNYSIVEFKSLASFFPGRFRAKRVIQNAVKYLNEVVRDGDKIIVYHSISICKYYKRIISSFGASNSHLLVAEIYSDVGNLKYDREKEIKNIKQFSKYIFMSSGLKEAIVDKKQKSLMLYGTYDQKCDERKEKTTDVVDLVYAGTASKIKEGLTNALSAMKYLPNNYLLHVYCHDATPEDVSEINSTPNTIFEGKLNERELINAIKLYDVGLATQNPYLPFNKTSFPSKITTYLSCGLSVVSSKSESVIDSPFNEIVHYYDEGDKRSIALAIIDAKNSLSVKSPLHFISRLDEMFKKNIEELLEG